MVASQVGLFFSRCLWIWLGIVGVVFRGCCGLGGSGLVCGGSLSGGGSG